MRRAAAIALALVSAATTATAATAVPWKLTLDEATRRALEANTSLAVERQSAGQASDAVRAARGAYDFVVSSDVGWTRATDPVNSLFSGAPGDALAPENRGLDASVGVTRLLPTGATVDLFTSWGRTTTNGVYTSLSPAYETDVGVSFRQPLLRNLSIDPAREAIRVASAGRVASAAHLEQVVSDTVARVDAAYWDLVAARRDAASLESSVALAAKQLDETKTRIQMGTMSKTDVAEPTAELERRKASLALARGRVEAAENALKLLVLGDPDDPGWASRIVPEDAPETNLVHPDLDRALAQGLAKRPEIDEARARRTGAEAEVAGRRSDVRPALDFVASYERRGLAGSVNPAAVDFTGQPISVPPPLDGGSGRSYGTIGENRFPAVSVGLSLSLPLSNRTAKANLAVARSRLEQASLGVTAVRQAVVAEIRNAVSAVETAGDRTEAARAAREAAETQLAAEQDRFEAGVSTNFLVLTRQNDLTNARFAETSALTDYRKSETELARATGELLDLRHVTVESPVRGGASRHSGTR